MKYRTLFAHHGLLALLLTFSMSELGRAQGPEQLPDDFNQLMETKTGLLTKYSELRKAGHDQQSLQVLRSIVNVHRKALNVAKATQQSAEVIDQLQKVYAHFEIA